MRVIIKSAWRWRKQKSLPNITFAFVDNQGIVGQRNVIRFLWFSIYYHTAASNKTFNRREFVRALMEASEQAKDHKSVDQDRWKCHLMRSLLIVQLRNDTLLNNFSQALTTLSGTQLSCSTWRPFTTWGSPTSPTWLSLMPPTWSSMIVCKFFRVKWIRCDFQFVALPQYWCKYEVSEENTSKVPWTLRMCDMEVDIKVI